MRIEDERIRLRGELAGLRLLTALTRLELKCHADQARVPKGGWRPLRGRTWGEAISHPELRRTPRSRGGAGGGGGGGWDSRSCGRRGGDGGSDRRSLGRGHARADRRLAAGACSCSADVPTARRSASGASA